MLPQELDGVTLLVDVPLTGIKAGDGGVILAIRRADDGRLIYTVELDGADGRKVDLDSSQFGLD
ncbi:MAG: hypothetical protein K0R83_362 [Caulobacter sp.]|jgi:hypothetical protein|nr:hypothetical protein [Caulobacter sp.]